MVFYCQNLFAKEQLQPWKSNLPAKLLEPRMRLKEQDYTVWKEQ